MKKKAARSKVQRRPQKRTLLQQLLDKKHRPFHGVAVGTILVLLKEVLAVLAVAGLGLIVLSTLAFAVNRYNHK